MILFELKLAPVCLIMFVQLFCIAISQYPMGTEKKTHIKWQRCNPDSYIDQIKFPILDLKQHFSPKGGIRNLEGARVLFQLSLFQWGSLTMCSTLSRNTLEYIETRFSSSCKNGKSHHSKLPLWNKLKHTSLASYMSSCKNGKSQHKDRKPEVPF